MPARLSAFAIWALVAAGAVFWALRLLVAVPAQPSHARPVVAEGPAPRADLSRLLGAPAVSAVPAPSPAAARLRLLGVLAPGAKTPGSPGIALIALDGKPARALRVGAALDDALVLLAVTARTASLGPREGPPSVVLELPPPAPPATGRPPAAAAIPAVPEAVPASGALDEEERAPVRRSRTLQPEAAR